MSRNAVRSAVVLALLTMTLAPAHVAAAGDTADLTTTAGGTNWRVAVYDTDAWCGHVELWYNYTTSSQTQTLALWMMNPGQGFARSALIWGEPVEGRVHLQVLGTDAYDLRMQTLGVRTQAYFDLGQHCGFRRFALASPTAENAHLRITPVSGSPSITTAYGGNDAFVATADDFRGTKVEAGLDAGASAAALASWDTTVAPGLMATFASTDQAAWLQANHPDGRVSAGFCSGAGRATTTCSAPLGNIGLGEGPGGTWRFQVNAEAGVELFHVYAVGAPLDWGGT